MAATMDIDGQPVSFERFCENIADAGQQLPQEEKPHDKEPKKVMVPEKVLGDPESLASTIHGQMVSQVPAQGMLHARSA
jgi:hypothetical protein